MYRTRQVFVVALAAIVTTQTACQTLNTQQEKGTAIGAAGGAVVGGVVGKATGSTARGAIVGAVVGGAAGAIIGSVSGNAGHGAAIGAGTGLLFGSAAGANAAGYNSYDLQRRYDGAYLQCMYAKGNQVPARYGPRAYGPPPGWVAPPPG